MIRFDSVGMRYGPGSEVLRDISFQLEQGSFTFLTGPSGAGKSSLLRLIYLAHRPSRGLITMFGRDVAGMARHELPAFRRRIGVVFQSFRLLEHLSVFDNVALPLRVAGTREGAVQSDVAELLDWVGLAGRMHVRPALLSGGEQQRVAIARAVVGRPDVLVADEPTGNVDPAMAERLMRLFEGLNEVVGTTVLFATHDATLIGRRGHPVMVLEDGELRRQVQP